MILEIHSLVCTNGEVYVELQVLFRVLVAYFTNVTKRIVKNQVVSSILPNLEKVIQIHPTFADLVGPAEEPTNNYQPQ